MPVDPSHGERLAARVSALYGAAELSLLRRIARALARGDDSPAWAIEKYAQLDWLRTRGQADVDELTTTALAEARSVLTRAYVTGQALAVTDLDSLGREVRLPQARAGALKRIADETLRVLAPVGQRILRGSLDVYAQTVAEATSTVLLGANTRRDAAQHALNRLTERGVTSFTDRAGRTWQAESYVEMAVRTGTGQAVLTGHTEQLVANDVDLVMVSDSPRECDLCRPWEGKVLSIGGAVAGVIERPSVTDDKAVRVRVAGTLDEARAAGLNHPNCRHQVSAYLPGASRPATNTADTDARYDEEQRQRQMERTIRKWKTRQAAALTPEAEAAAKAKVRYWQGRVREHLAATEGLTRKSAREQVGRAR